MMRFASMKEAAEHARRLNAQTLRYPRFVSVAGKIYLRVQVDGEDREVGISRDQAWNLMLDLASFMALQEREKG